LSGIYDPPTVEFDGGDEETVMNEALQQPLGTKDLTIAARDKDKIVILISDLTRACPSYKMLPPLLERLEVAGAGPDNVTIVTALGLHRRMSWEEMEQAVGSDVFARYPVINHDIDDVVYMGTTSRGTAVDVFRPVVESDFRIALGHVEFHYFAGFSGGAKALVPGTASKRTIEQNHRHMLCFEARAAALEDNPVRLDLEEAAAFVGVDFTFNVLLDEDKSIVAAAAGDVQEAHRSLAAILAGQGLVTLEQPVDIAVVSPGGHPKDINLYQAQKALDNCADAVRDGGTLILAAACPEGFGEETFEQWLKGSHSPDQVLQWIEERFVLGGHKAAAVAKIARRLRLILVSDGIGRPFTGMDCYQDLQHALDSALERHGPGASVGIFHRGASMLCAARRE